MQRKILGMPIDLNAPLSVSDPEIAEQIKKEVGEGVKVLPFKLDVSVPEEVKAFVGNLPEEWREIDVLVNNAYVQSPKEDV